MEVDLKQIKDIIKTCAENGVLRFKMQDIEVEFAENTQMLPKSYQKPVKVKDNPVKREEIEQEAMEKAELQVKDEYVDNLILEDPAEFERLEIEGELRDEKTLNSGAEQAL